MTLIKENTIESLGSEPLEIFGFSTEEELDLALLPLMKEISEEGKEE